eukprot:m.231309 g.231309  ORF g.231309 m.231309 type:complete len:116 (-) comp18319_c0_seq1:240-587(-)
MSHALKLGLGVREFLPNWPVILLNVQRLKPNEVALRVLPKMNKLEIREYMEKIYGLKVDHVSTRNVLGRRRKTNTRGVFDKQPDYKVAFLTLKEGTFKFPDLFPEKDENQSEESK